jgi:hypothetical protein
VVGRRGWRVVKRHLENKISVLVKFLSTRLVFSGDRDRKCLRYERLCILYAYSGK